MSIVVAAHYYSWLSTSVGAIDAELSRWPALHAAQGCAIALALALAAFSVSRIIAPRGEEDLRARRGLVLSTAFLLLSGGLLAAALVHHAANLAHDCDHDQSRLSNFFLLQAAGLAGAPLAAWWLSRAPSAPRPSAPSGA